MLEIFLMSIMSVAVAYISFQFGREYGRRLTYRYQEEIIAEKSRYINLLLDERRAYEKRDSID